MSNDQIFYVHRYCKTVNIIPQRTKHGAYMVPNVAVLRQFKKIYKDVQERKETLSHNGIEMVQCEQNAAHVNTTVTYPLSHMKVVLRDSGERPYTISASKISRNHILNTAKSGKEIVARVMATKVDCKVETISMNCFPHLQTVLKRLQKNHKHLNYAALLEQLLRQQSKTKELKHACKISRKQLHEYFRVTLGLLLPPELFGKYKNKRKIMKAVYGLLDSACFEVFELGYFVNKLDLQSIGWLKLIDQEKRYFALAKLVKWLFSGIILPILYSQFHVMKDSKSYERTFIRIVDYRRMRKKFLKKLVRKGHVSPAFIGIKGAPACGTLKLFVKNSGVRPIVRKRYRKAEKKKNDMLVRFLEQLYLTQSDWMTDHNFHEHWRKITNKQVESRQGNLHLTSCDIANAFGSVVQAHLYDILKVLCRDVPETLYYESYVLLCRDHKTEVSKRYFSNLQLSVPRGVIFASKIQDSQTIKKIFLLGEIEKCIFVQEVKISGKRYIIKKGLAQGSATSPILANIYYNFIFQQNMSLFIKSGLLMRYVDDVLYVTEDNTTALEFLQLIKRGIPKYNCRFKESKTQTNILPTTTKGSKYIEYFGYKICPDTLEVEPTYQEAHPRYLLSHIVPPEKKILQVLQLKLNNFASLKLTGVVLDDRVNSHATIKSIVKRACLRVAWRARLLILYLFDNLQLVVQRIFQAIVTCNIKIASTIVRRICIDIDTASRSKQRKWHRIVINMLFSSYKKVFKSEDRLRYYFKSLLHL